MRAVVAVVAAGVAACAPARIERGEARFEGARIEGPLQIVAVTGDGAGAGAGAAVLALAVDERRVITGGADGTLVVRDRADGGAVMGQQRTRAGRCGAWAISPSRRWAVCATERTRDRYGRDELADEASTRPLVEWFAVERGEADGGVLGPASGLMAGESYDPWTLLAWLDDGRFLFGRRMVDRARRAPSGRFDLSYTRDHSVYVEWPQREPTHAAAIDPDEIALAGMYAVPRRYASTSPSPPIVYAQDPRGLAVWRHTGREYTVLDARVEVLALAAARDVIAIATPRELRLWHRAHLTAIWHIAWTSDVVTSRVRSRAGTIPALAVSPRWIAVAEDRGTMITVRDADTGDIVGTLDIAGYDVYATALAWSRDQLFVGTSTGRVIELRVMR